MFNEPYRRQHESRSQHIEFRRDGISRQKSSEMERDRFAGGGSSLERTLLPPNSLLTGKNTGNFSISCRNSGGEFLPTTLNSLGFFLQSPQLGAEKNMEFIKQEQGIIRQEQEITTHVSGKRHFQISEVPVRFVHFFHNAS